MGILDPSFGEVFGQDPKGLANRGPHAEVPSAVPALPAIEPDMQAGFADLHKQQQAGVAAHRDYARRLAQVKDAAQERSSDLGLAERLETMFNPQVPKSAKQFLFKEMSRTLGIDPATASAKEIGAMLTGLDPQGAASMKALIAEQAGTASPGALQGLMRGVLSGQVPMHQVVQMAGAAGQQRAAKVGEEVGQNFKGVDAQVAGSVQVEEEANGLPRPTGAPPMPLQKAEVAREFVRLLGKEVPKDAPLTYGEIEGYGYSPPGDLPTQRKRAGELQQKETAANDLFANATTLEALTRGRPETLTQAGWVARSIDAMAQAGEGVARQFGLTSEVDLKDPEVKKATERAVRAVMRASGAPEDTAAVVRSLIVHIGYSTAASLYGQADRGLSNTDFEQALKSVGESQSPAQMAAVLADLSRRVYDRYTGDLSTTVGKRLEMNVQTWDPDKLRQVAASPITPDKLAKVVIEQIKENKTKAAQGDQPPTARAERAPTEIEKREKAFAERQQKLDAEAQADKQTGRDRSKRHDAMSEEQLEMARRREESADREEARRDRSEARADRAEARAEAEKKRARIQDAFEKMGKGVANAGGSGSSSAGSSGDGGAQDANAFKLPQRPVRQPPQIGRGGR